MIPGLIRLPGTFHPSVRLIDGGRERGFIHFRDDERVARASRPSPPSTTLRPQTKTTQPNPNQTKPNQTKPNQTNPKPRTTPTLTHANRASPCAGRGRASHPPQRPARRPRAPTKTFVWPTARAPPRRDLAIDDSGAERNHEAPTRKTPSGKERKSGEKRGAATAKSEADRG